MSGRKFILPVICAITLAGGAAYFHLKGTSKNALNPQVLTRVIPEAAGMTKFISMDPKTWSKLKKLGTPEARRIVSQRLKHAQKKLSADSKINYGKDLKSQVGNAALASLPSAKSSSSKAPSILMVIGIKSKMSALNFANKLKNESKVKAIETDYQGEKMMNFPDEKRSNYMAILKD